LLIFVPENDSIIVKQQIKKGENMKKFKALMLMISILCLGFVSCGNNDDDVTTTHTVRVEVTFDTSVEVNNPRISIVHTPPGRMPNSFSFENEKVVSPFTFELRDVPRLSGVTVGTSAQGLMSLPNTRIRVFVDEREIQPEHTTEGMQAFNIRL